jgi:RNA polymerase sigma-70 factor, ECF subfamily
MHTQAPSLTELLLEAQRNGPAGWDEAIPAVYDELHRLASAHFANERGPHLLQPTALIHEAWIKLVRLKSLQFENRSHFYSICSRLMRQILIDHARRAQLETRVIIGPASESVASDALDHALDALSKLNPRHAQIVEMRYFGGMSIEEIASELAISPRTVKREWSSARLWLCRELAPLTK